MSWLAGIPRARAAIDRVSVSSGNANESIARDVLLEIDCAQAAPTLSSVGLFRRARADVLRLPERLDRLPGKRILVLAPHPDDEAIGCGGALCHYDAAKAHTTVLFMTDGEGGNTFCGLVGQELIAQRRAETAAAAALLGIDERRFLSLPDGRLAVNRTSIRKVAAEIERARPDVLFVPSPFEHHCDHSATFYIASHALTAYSAPIDVLVYEVWAPLVANCALSIDFACKAEAIRAYMSQLDEHQLYVAASEGLGRYRAVTALLEPTAHAECYWRGERRAFLRFATVMRRSVLGPF